MTTNTLFSNTSFSTPQFSGSYPSNDVHLLLTPIQMAYTDTAEKERLIQTGTKHYSEMLSKEEAPSIEHLSFYQNALNLFGRRLAQDVISLAKGLIEQIPHGPIVLVSLVRAGTPLGVCLLHALHDMGRDAVHFGISIIRDKGIDHHALRYILQHYSASQLVFVDGWVGKGAIFNELHTTLVKHHPQVTPRLVVLTDLGGHAWLTASYDDWLIPFGILGATVSGLISRSLFQDDHFHGVAVYEHLQTCDMSQQFIHYIDHLRQHISQEEISAIQPNGEQQQQIKQQCEHIVHRLQREYHITSSNRIKPGIAEATRAVMRRVPERILVRNKTDVDLCLLHHLAKKTHTKIEEVGDILGHYRAVTLIKHVA